MVLAQIHNLYKELTAAEQKIASFVISYPSKVVYMTAKDLSSECGVAPSAVIRFCHDLGYDGFSAFKIALASSDDMISSSAKGRQVDKLPAFSPDDDVEEVFGKVFSSSSRTLKDTLGMINFSQVRAVCDALAGAERILVFGVGTSSVIAIDAQYRFAQLGLPASAYTDALFMNVTAANAKKGDVVIGVSHSGRTKAVVDAVKRAKTAGALTVALTSFRNSPLSSESDYVLCAFADEENYPVEAVSARVAHLCIIDALAMTLATYDYDGFKKHVTNKNEILEEIRYQ